MRRMIQIKDNKMNICAETIGAPTLSFALVATVTLTGNAIDLQLTYPERYQLREHLTAREKVRDIITCLTRAKADEITDMHELVNIFFDKTMEGKSGSWIFSRDGSLPNENQPVVQIGNQF